LSSLLSFAKFLELLVYSSRLCTLSRHLCPHTTPPPQPWTGDDAPLPRSRFNIIRCFAYKSHSISFALSPIQDIFELRLPRLQMTRTPEREHFNHPSILSATRTEMEGSDEKKAQWKEIKSWWQLIAEHLDKLVCANCCLTCIGILCVLSLDQETHFDDDPMSTYRKSLPRIPSTWDEGDEASISASTPKPKFSSLPPTTPSSPLATTSQLLTVPTETPPRPQSVPLEVHELAASVTADGKSPEDRSAEALTLLTNMRFAFQRKEQELYTRLQAVPENALNDVRREFHSAGLGSLRRLAAWEAKHLAKDAKDVLAAEQRAVQEPWWWGETYHAVPGSNVIIKDDDWGSIIAFTLRYVCCLGSFARSDGAVASSLDYQDELSDMTHHHRLTSTLSTSPSIPEDAPVFGMSSPGAPFSPAHSTASESSFKFFAKPVPMRLDPDNDDVVWAEPETCSAVITRKEHPRDPTALLSLREVLRHRAPIDGTLGLPPGLLTSVSRIVSGGGGSESQASMYAKPAVELSKQVADGTVVATDPSDTIGKLLHELDGASVVSRRSAGSKASVGSSFVTTNIERRKTASVISHDSEGSAVGSEESEETAGHAGTLTRRGSDATETGTEQSGPEIRSPSPAPTHGSTFSSWTNSLSNAMRFMSKGVEHHDSPTRGAHHDLLAANAGHIDERPHIKYDWTIGKRLKYSCTVYYAKQFDLLRRQCGVGDEFLKSMARSANWSTDGGKSKSNFWKTADDRFIIKTLINAWNVADLCV
jgi:1-phosphatidylinositol-3-phosphate 5-kinase